MRKELGIMGCDIPDDELMGDELTIDWDTVTADIHRMFAEAGFRGRIYEELATSIVQRFKAVINGKVSINGVEMETEIIGHHTLMGIAQATNQASQAVLGKPSNKTEHHSWFCRK